MTSACETKKSGKGRPRNQEVHLAILKAALEEVEQVGFRGLSIESIAARAKVGKTSIYRRWPNKAAVIMDAFIELIGPETEFPQGETVHIRIQKQLRLQASFFSGTYGQIIRQLLGEAQFDTDLAQAFNDRWLQPRRLMTKRIFEEGVAKGELKINNFDLATDLLYGPFYYRLVLKNAPLDDQFSSDVFNSWINTYGI